MNIAAIRDADMEMPTDPSPPLSAYTDEGAKREQAPPRKGNGADGATVPAAQAAQAVQDGEHLLAHAFWMREASLTLDLPYIVKGLFGKKQIVVLWGSPGSGKSFNATEISACVGAGVNWRGRKTKRGIVLYVVAESSRPYIANRITALKRERPELADAALLVVPLALDLLHAQAGDVDRIIKTAEVLAAGDGEVVLIVIDTLATTFGGGNENAPEDMGLYVANLLYIRDQTGAAVLVVHHCGKDEAKGMRGHSALLGVLDAELAVEGAAGQDRILRTGKVRDGDGNLDLFAFRLKVVELGVDAEGDPVRTCVVEALDEAGTQRTRRQRKGVGLGKHQKAVLRVLEEAGGRMVRINLAHQLKDEGMPRNRVHDALGALLDSGMVIANNEAKPPEVLLA